jgi:hypothetical protein
VGGEGDSQIPDREVGCLTREEVGGQIFLLLITFDGHHLSFGNVASQAGCPTEGIEDGPDDEEVLEGPKRRPEGGGVNGSQSKFLTEFGLYPKINPKPQHAKSRGA